MAVVNEAKTVKPEALDAKTREMVASAALDELPRARKRIAELEGQLATRRGIGFRMSQFFGTVIVATVMSLAIVAAVAIGHRLIVWGWP